MTLSKVVLHVGPAKTGTTAIQAALSAISGDLCTRGIFYPATTPPDREGQHSLAWEILERLRTPIARLNKARLTWAEVFQAAEQYHAHTLLVSSEEFTLALFDEHAFAELRATLGELPVTVIFGVRDPLRTVPSAWQQSVKWGVGCGEELLQIDDAVPLISRGPHVQVIPYLEMVESALRCEIRLFTVPSHPSTEVLLRGFAYAADLHAEVTAKLCASGRTEDANRRISYRYLRVLLRLNRLMAEEAPSESQYPNSVSERRLLARQALLDVIPTEEEEDIPLSVESRVLLIGLRERIAAWLMQRSETAEIAADLLAEPGEQGLPFAAGSVGIPEDDLISLLARALGQQTDRIIKLHAYLSQVEQARDWWKSKSDSWQQQAEGHAR